MAEESADSAGWTVEGRVTARSDAKVVLRLYDVYLRTREQLGQATLSPDGLYRISYSPEAALRAGKAGPDLQVEAYGADGDSLLGASEMRLGAGMHERIDLSLDALVPPSEFELLQSRIPPLLGRVPPHEIDDQELVQLGRLCQLGVQAVRAYRQAHRSRTQHPELSLQHLYALHRWCPDQSIAILALVGPHRVKELLSESILGGHIAAEGSDAISQGAVLMHRCAIRDANAKLQPFLANGDLERLLEGQFETRGRSQSGFTALLILSNFDKELASRIRNCVPADSSMECVAEWTEDAWGAVLGVSDHDHATTDSSANPPASRIIDARSLAGASERLFPTRAFGARLTALPEATRLLREHADVDLRRMNVRALVEGRAAALVDDAGVPFDAQSAIDQLETLQRMLPFAPSVQSMESLLESGLSTASSVSRLSEAAFANSFEQDFGDRALAQAAHRSATRLAGTATLMAGDLYTRLRRILPRALSHAGAAPDDIANLPELFGPQDLCVCAECQSQTSPAAYLVDLLAFLDPPALPGAPATPLSVLLARRPDLAELPLSCENSGQLLPLIDLINELLESFVVNGRSMGSAAHDSAGTTQAERRARPQFTLEGAYSKLAEGVFPFSLPFHRHLEDARASLTRLGIPRLHLLESLAVDERGRRISSEALQLSSRQRGVIVGELPDIQLHQFYGFDRAEGLSRLNSVSELLERTRLDFAGLLELFDTRWINPDPSAPKTRISTDPQSPCDVSAMTIVGLDRDALDRIHRFVRLRIAIATTTTASIADLDLTIRAIGNGRIDDNFIDALADACTVQRALGLTWSETCSLWADIDVHGAPSTPSSARSSYYTRLFADRAVQNPPDHDLQLGVNGEVNGSAKPIESKLAILAAIFQVPIAALDLVLRDAGLTAADPLSLRKLSLIQRYTLLCRALKMPPTELVELKNISFSDPFLSPSSTRKYLALVEELRPLDLPVGKLAYLLRHLDADRFGPPDAAARELVNRLEAELTRVQHAAAEVGASQLSGVRALIASAQPPLSPEELDLRLDVAMNLVLGRLEVALPIKRQIIARTLWFLDPDEAEARLGSAVPESDVAEKASRERWVSDRGASGLQYAAVTERVLADALSLEVASVRILIRGALPALTLADGPLASDFRLSALVASRSDAPLHARIVTSCVRCLKVAEMLRQLSTTTAELTCLTLSPKDFGDWDLARVPYELEVTPDSKMWAAWTSALNLVRIRAFEVKGSHTLLEVMRLAQTGSTREDVLTALSNATAWDREALDALTGVAGLHLAVVDFRNARRLGDIAIAIKAWSTSAVTPQELLSWVTEEPNAAMASAIRNALKSRYDRARWESLAGAVSDSLRERCRSALVDYVLQMPEVAGLGVTTPDHLSQFFLIDVGMSACATTSRVKQAISTVQLFIQRCVLNLEPAVAPSSIDAARWVWMKSYRVWEANRKVFLFPENWIEPELRDDKSQFFRELESELVQSDVNLDTAETAFRNYLYKLDAVSRLQICGICRDADDNCHVFGRTFGQSPQHFYRNWDGSVWTTWERVTVDIQGDLAAPTLMPIVHNRRLYLFWPIIADKSASFDDQYNTGSGSDNKKPRRYLEVALAYSEYRQGNWTPKRVSSGSVLSLDDKASLFSTPPRERHALRAEINPITNDLTVRLIVEMAVRYGGQDYPQKPSASTDTCVRLGSWTLSGCGGDLITNSRLRLGDRPDVQYEYEALIDRSAVPKDANLEGVGYRAPALASFTLQVDTLPGTTLSTVLQDTPSAFHVVPAQVGGAERTTFPRFTLDDAFRPFVFQDASRTYWVAPVAISAERGDTSPPSEAEDHSLPTDIRHVLAGLLSSELAEHTAAAPGNSKLRFEAFWHPHVCAFMKSLNEGGIQDLLALDNQRRSADTSSNAFQRLYRPTPLVDLNYPTEGVSFDLQSSYGAYNTELFLHAPMLIAARLHREHRFEEARRWYHFLFDPTNDSAELTPLRFWRSMPLRNDAASGNIGAIVRALTDPSENPELRRQAERQVEHWLRNPFQPHRIARLRPVAYQIAVFMGYLDNLIAWGDQLFSQDTVESINEAAQLYSLAADLLGPRPNQIRLHEESAPPTFTKIRESWHGPGATLTAIETALTRGGLTEWLTSPSGSSSLGVAGLFWSREFCVPANEKLLAYWDTVGDRLFKIRHCQNISGVVRSLPLFEPPIDPALLVRATALGVDLATAMSDTQSGLGTYRFRVQIARALGLTSELRTFGSALLTALERKDSEAIATLRSSHEGGLLRLTREVLKQQVSEATAALDALRRAQDLTRTRFEFYDKIKPISAREELHLRLLDTAQAFQSIAQVGEIASNATALLPNFVFGSSGSMSSPVVTASFGGANLSSALSAASRSMALLSAIMTHQANRTATLAAWERRSDEWELQASTAQTELQQIDRQIAAGEIRLAIAELDLFNHDARTEFAATEEAALRGKYTNEELFSWTSSELSGLYFQMYSLGHRAAQRAEQAFNCERNLPVGSPRYIQFRYWDSRRKGLLSGERLALDLRRLEAAYFEQDAREHEVVKRISLVSFDPVAFLQLKASGSCEFDLPEALFDLDHPGHYYRRIKAVSLTIPAVAGPYTGVSALLELISSTIRCDPSISGGYPAQASDPRFRQISNAGQSIVTSHGQDDYGLFEANLQDERYLPFEGSGAISRWRLELPPDANAFDVDSVADVVINIRYTAHFARSLRGAAAAAAVLPPRELTTAPADSVSSPDQPNRSRLFSLRHEFPDAWRRWLHLSESGASGQSLLLDVGTDRFPWHLKGAKIAIKRVELMLAWTPNVRLATTGSGPSYPGSGSVLQVSVSPPSPGSQSLLRLSTDELVLGGQAFGGVELAQAGKPGEWTLHFGQDSIDALDSSLTVDETQAIATRRRLNPDLISELVLVLYYATSR